MKSHSFQLDKLFLNPVLCVLLIDMLVTLLPPPEPICINSLIINYSTVNLDTHYNHINSFIDMFHTNEIAKTLLHFLLAKMERNSWHLKLILEKKYMNLKGV